jgi:peroxiredoxin
MQLTSIRILLVTLFLHSVSIVFAGSNPTTKITCNIFKPTASSLAFSLISDIVKETELREEIAFPKGQKTIEKQFQIDEPTVIRVTYDTRSFDCYVEPGNQLHLFFEGDKFPQQIDFEGDAAIHNTYLHGITTQFQKYNQKLLNRKMFASSSLNFRAYIDQITKQKWAFHRAYNPKEKEKFSAAFVHFAAANIDYWRASQLMQYREEHETALLTESASNIPDEFYTFLDETLINNDEAMTNPYYRNFLRQYGWFRVEHPSFRHGLAARQTTFLVTAPSITLYESIDLVQAIATFPKHSRLIVTDKMAYEVEDEKTPIAYRLRVHTTDGLDGWIRPIGINLERVSEINQNVLFIENFEINKKKNHIDATIQLDSLRVYTDQDDANDNYVTKLAKKDKVSVLNAQTVENRSYLDLANKLSYTAPFQKIRTSTGILGWVTSIALQKQWLISDITEQKAEVDENSRTLYNNIDYFFFGKAKYYLAALLVSDGFSKGKTLNVRPLFNILKKENTSLALAKSLENILAEAEKNKDKTYQSPNEQRRRLMRQSVALNIAPPIFRLPYSSSALSNVSTSVEEESILIANERKKKGFSNKKNINQYKPKNLEVLKFEAKKYNAQPAIIKQSGDLATAKNANFYIQNSLLNEYFQHITLSEKREGGRFSKKQYAWETQIAEPTLGMIYTEKDSFEVFLEPNDVLELEHIEKNKKIHTTAKGKGSFKFRYLQASKKNFAKIDRELKEKKGAYLSTEDFKVFMDSKLAQKDDFFEKFPHHEQFSVAFKEYCQADIYFWYANQLLSYPYYIENFNNNKSEEIIVSEHYYDFLNQKGKHTEYAIYSNEYRKFIELYQILAAKSNKEGGRIFPPLTLHQRAMNYRQAQHLLGDLSNGFLDNKKVSAVQAFVEKNDFPGLSESVIGTYRGKTASEEGTTAPSFSLLNSEGKTNTLSEYKGKVVYLYFWKSTDPNHENAAKLLRDLKAEYAKRNVVFLNINLDETQEDWKNSLSEHKNMGVHLFHQNSNFYEAPVEVSYQILKTPTAVLLDERGRIAKVPSTLLNDNTMIQKLEELLNK